MFQSVKLDLLASIDRGFGPVQGLTRPKLVFEQRGESGDSRCVFIASKPPPTP
jgi:hypothetical protein